MLGKFLTAWTKPEFTLGPSDPEEAKADRALEADDHNEPKADPAAPMAAPVTAALLLAVPMLAFNCPL